MAYRQRHHCAPDDGPDTCMLLFNVDATNGLRAAIRFQVRAPGLAPACWRWIVRGFPSCCTSVSANVLRSFQYVGRYETGKDGTRMFDMPGFEIRFKIKVSADLRSSDIPRWYPRHTNH